VVIETILLVLMLVAGLWTVLSRDLLQAAIWLGATSLLLALVMFRLAAPLAAVFELSVCAGLITVIFASAISLLKPRLAAEVQASGKERMKRYFYLPILLVVAGVGLYFQGTPASMEKLGGASTAGVGAVLWNLRQPDLLGQLLILMAGAFGVVVLFKERKHD
jgi:NADH-quinone oxidoreductase subunit J